MKLREIVLGESDERKRETILNYTGRQVILKDEHYEWCHGTLQGEEEGYMDSYMLKIEDAIRERRLYYHDLQQLLIIRSK
ncbi:MAG TPA: hypothetical protein HA250_04535 [Nanoarchaeota archaeon]|nr:hypothetical protein [Nanoarchaeota archaeon]HIH51591.1 hypothetical protein [Nanoarchaeota archaeon]